ncbi:cation diffusion facilitator family transporter [Aquifex aeolicus]|uniref:Cation efflux system (CzcD-like) n=1 Tax=Aquifex aeolicus (strain VF5) TaxID=224324 RepID=O67168_AQUAE|nr:cation diffusion facilitator family transporter [Aquifex aeolicus]AAC07126.1 cation efflux system (czcD-like) [Aquifex aeolicus VF5]
MEREKSLKVLAFSFLLIFLFAFIEFLGGLLTNSLALLSDAGHMLTDAVSLSIALVAQYLALKVKTKRTTYGLYRLEVLAALVNGVFLLGLIGYIILEAIHRFENPEPVKPQMIYIAFAGLIVNLVVGYILLKHSEENINIKSALLHVATDTLGSVAAIIAGIAIVFWKFYLADPILSVAVALLILPSAYSVIKETVNVLLEVAPSHINTEELEKELLNLQGVKGVHDLHVWSITPGTEVLTVHVVVEDTSICNDILKEVEKIAHKYGIKHTTVQLEKEGYACAECCPLLSPQGLKFHHHHHHGHEHEH